MKLKKILAAGLAAIMVFSMAACSSDDKNNDKDSSKKTEKTTEKYFCQKPQRPNKRLCSRKE